MADVGLGQPATAGCLILLQFHALNFIMVQTALFLGKRKLSPQILWIMRDWDCQAVHLALSLS